MTEPSSMADRVPREVRTEITRLFEDAIGQHTFPGAVLHVAYAERVVFHEAFGHAKLYPEPEPMTRDAVFDLASLTKPLGAALATALLVDRGDLEWNGSLGELLDLPASTSSSMGRIQVRHLLEHTSGLPAFRAYYPRFRGREGLSNKERVREWILRESLAGPPGTRACYSDLGYMLLEGVIERIAGQELDGWLEQRLFRPLGLNDTGFRRNDRAADPPDRFVQTAYCAYRKRYLQGEVHDRNAFAMGGFSGHAGLFGSVRDVHVLLSLLYRCWSGEEGLALSPKRVRELFTGAGSVESNTFRMGFDTPSAQGSSAGTLFARNSVGHLGFTGTSFWMDLESGFSVILLTNRLLARPRNARIRGFRPRLHDLVWKSMRESGAFLQGPK
ncbi:MAG: serine hydrolase [Deltaproteobacteria bacterium]|nr:serine hydrolase [Deltaproteobacteria bacterium]